MPRCSGRTAWALAGRGSPAKQQYFVRLVLDHMSGGTAALLLQRHDDEMTTTQVQVCVLDCEIDAFAAQFQVTSPVHCSEVAVCCNSHLFARLATSGRNRPTAEQSLL